MAATDSHPPQGTMALGARAVRLGRHVANHNAVVLLLPLGLGIILIGAADSSLSDQLRWLMALVGWAAAFLGFRALGRLKWGNSFDPGLWLAVGWVAIVVLAAVFADLLPLAEAVDTVKALTEPSRKRPELFSRHPLGTDNQGLDILGGVIYGARISLQVSLLAVTVGILVGGIAGTVAGYFRGIPDMIFGFITDSLLAFPPLVLLLAVVAAINPTVWTISLALALLGIPTMGRLARANTLTFAQREFVLAARSLGASRRRVIFRELIPNVVRPLLSYAFLIVAVLIVAEASLSFLNVGISRPTPTWGNMIAAGESKVKEHPHMVFVPGIVMFVTVYSINRIGDAARRRWDPREASL